LIPVEKMKEGELTIRCACGGVIRYTVAEVEMTVGGRQICVEAGASDTLLTSVLLGVDVPEMQGLLRESCAEGSVEGRQMEKAWVVETRAQARLRERRDAIEKVKEMTSTAMPTPVVLLDDVEGGVAHGDDADFPVYEFAEEVFKGGRERQGLTRRQKRQGRQRYREEKQSRGAEVEEGPPELTSEELKKLQQEDPMLEVARRLTEEGEASSGDRGFFYRDGLLMRRWMPVGVSEKGEGVEQLVLPQTCRAIVMELAHNIPMAGHLGKTKTVRRILQRFYWPTLHHDVANFCCGECQKSASQRVPRAPLIPLPIMSVPFDGIAMDIVGPLPRSKSGHRYILVLCDYGTRYPEAVPLRNIDAEHVVEELVKVFARVGIPSEVLTDQGTNFMLKLLSEVYRLLSVKVIRTSPYHPQTDGLIERFNQTLKAMLQKVGNNEGRDWDRWLPYVLFAYREVTQALTGFSPFELLYGRSVRGPLDVLREAWEADSCGEESVVSYILMIRERLEKMAEVVQENLSKAQRQQKEWYDKNARSWEFQPGDQVLVLLPTSTEEEVFEGGRERGCVLIFAD
jgi:hypothetical protein